MIKIALISLEQLWEDKEANLELCKKYIQKAYECNADLIIFPEMTLTGFSNNIKIIAEDFKNSQTIKSFSILAKKYKMGIIFGVVVKNGNKGLNESIFMDNNGKIIGKYIKIHPFSLADEDKFFDPGDKLSIADFTGIKFGLTICYDLRFPELYSALGKQSDIVVNIANWPAKRVNHWDILLRARAIENQIFMIGVNRIGKDENGLEYVESSKIINANGDELGFDKYNDMKIYEIDTKWTKDFKMKFNTVKDRKIEFYKEIL